MAKTDATGKADEEAWVFASTVSIKAGGFIASLANDLAILILLGFFFPHVCSQNAPCCNCGPSHPSAVHL